MRAAAEQLVLVAGRRDRSARTPRQGAAVHRDHAVDDHDAARRAAAARAARSSGRRRRPRTNRGCCRRWPGRPPEPNAPTLKWEGLDYRVDWFGAEHARLKRIREQIDVAGTRRGAGRRRRREDRRRAARADLHAGARRSGRPGAARRRHRAAPQLRPRSGRPGMRRDFAGVGAAARTGRRRHAVARRGLAARPRHRAGAARAAPHRRQRNAGGADDQPERSADVRAHGDDAQSARAPRRGSRSHRRRDRARARARRRRPARTCRRCWRSREEAQLPASVRQTLPWTLTRTPELAPALFGLRDFLWLGKPDLPQATLDHWGVYAESLDNRLKTAMPAPSPWENFGGRADGGLIATQAPDLDAAPGGGDGPAEAAGAARPRPADVCGPGLLARRRFPLPGRLAGDDPTGTGAFAVAGRRLRGGAGRRRPVTAAVEIGTWLRLVTGLDSDLSTLIDFMRTHRRSSRTDRGALGAGTAAATR